ncbi:MAG: T9SS type A sorting domain-containing protein [Ignavibacteria bacterium]|nr:T9SS type A sorting domain-containing protein [Ignavibacteria bacterium]
MTRGILYFTVIILSIYSLYASEDPLRDTLWIRQMPLGGQNFSKPLFHPNGKTVFATSDQYMFEYDVATGTLLKTRATKSGVFINDYVITDNGKYILVGTSQDEETNVASIELWDADTGYVRSLSFGRLYYGITRMVLSPDNSKLYASFAPASMICRIDISSMTVEDSNETIGNDMALSPNGKTIIGTVKNHEGTDESMSFIINSSTLLPQYSLSTPIFRPHYSKNGDYIGGYTTTNFKNYAVVYDIQAQMTYKMSGHNSIIQDVSFSNDGKYMIAAGISTTSDSDKGGYTIWDIQQKKLLYEAPYFTGADFFSLSSDNSLYCAMNGGAEVKMWNFRNPIINSISENAHSSISLFPNPTQSSLTIQFPASERNISYSIYDMHGQEIMSDNISDSEVHQGFITINTESQMSGMYIVRIRVGAEIYTRHYYIVR